MPLLLDTNVVYRWLIGLPLPANLVDKVSREGAQVSVLAPWEMLIKHQIGKLALPTLAVADDIAAQGFSLLPLRKEHLSALPGLPLHHRDPFDRMLIAQAVADELTIVTSDKQFSAYLPGTWVIG